MKTLLAITTLMLCAAAGSANAVELCDIQEPGLRSEATVIVTQVSTKKQWIWSGSVLWVYTRTATSATNGTGKIQQIAPGSSTGIEVCSNADQVMLAVARMLRNYNQCFGISRGQSDVSGGTGPSQRWAACNVEAQG